MAMMPIGLTMPEFAQIPENAIVNCEIKILQWIDPETGGLRWQCFYDGEIPLSGVLGLLELAKLDMIQRTDNVFGEDDDSS